MLGDDFSSPEFQEKLKGNIRKSKLQYTEVDKEFRCAFVQHPLLKTHP